LEAKPSSATVVGSSSVRGVGSRGKEDETHVEAVKFVEIWMETSTGYLASYDMIAGKKLLHTRDYAKLTKTYMPIQVCNDIDTGGFWGRSFVSLQLPVNMEMEYTIGKVFRNIQDADAFGILVEPTTLGIPTEVYRGSDGIKRVRYEPDYSVPDAKPFQLMPAKRGKEPVDVIKMGVALGDKIANQPTEMMQGGAPGRVDSQAGLGFLYEVSNVPLTPTAAALTKAIIGCYRAVLNIAAMTWPQEKMVQVTLLDDSLAGITLDPSTGAMQLSENGIPHPDEIDVSVRAMLPKSKEQEKLELAEALKMGSIDMFEYRIMVRKRGLELPVGNDAEWQNYRRAMLENIVLFGDGKKPGQVIVNILDIHDIHIRVLQPFMARPEFYQASPEVRTAVTEHYTAHLMNMGAIPDQAPQLEEAAEEKAAQMGMNVPGLGGPEQQ
jgi:hypothetical protein